MNDRDWRGSMPDDSVTMQVSLRWPWYARALLRLSAWPLRLGTRMANMAMARIRAKPDLGKISPELHFEIRWPKS